MVNKNDQVLYKCNTVGSRYNVVGHRVQETGLDRAIVEKPLYRKLSIHWAYIDMPYEILVSIHYVLYNTALPNE